MNCLLLAVTQPSWQKKCFLLCSKSITKSVRNCALYQSSSLLIFCETFSNCSDDAVDFQASGIASFSLSCFDYTKNNLLHTHYTGTCLYYASSKNASCCIVLGAYFLNFNFFRKNTRCSPPALCNKFLIDKSRAHLCFLWILFSTVTSLRIEVDLHWKGHYVEYVIDDWHFLSHQVITLKLTWCLTKIQNSQRLYSKFGTFLLICNLESLINKLNLIAPLKVTLLILLLLALNFSDLALSFIKTHYSEWQHVRKH